MSVDFVAYGLILDDIVFPDGHTEMAKLGGGGPQAAFGMHLFSDRVGLVASAGADLPESIRPWFEEAGIDTEGIVTTQWPTPRAWQVMEADGRRTQVFRIPPEAVGAQLEYRMDRLPESYREAKGFHFGIHPDEPPLDFSRSLHALGAAVSIEPFKDASNLSLAELLRQQFENSDIYSPNISEAISILGPGSPQDLVNRFAELGGRLIALRLGTQGSLVYQPASGEMVHIPAVPVSVIDPIGAGNAYCGAFLVGWVLTGNIAMAGRYGSIAASFLVEQVGLPDPKRATPAEVLRRLKLIS